MVETNKPPKREKNQQSKIKINVKNNCLVFFKWMAFSPFHPPSSELTPTWFMHDIEKTVSITEHVTVVLAIPYTTTMRGGVWGQSYTF